MPFHSVLSHIIVKACIITDIPTAKGESSPTTPAVELSSSTKTTKWRLEIKVQGEHSQAEREQVEFFTTAGEEEVIIPVGVTERSYDTKTPIYAAMICVPLAVSMTDSDIFLKYDQYEQFLKYDQH